MGSKKDKKIQLSEVPAEEMMKYEIAKELGLLDKVLDEGWGALSARETGKIGGIVNNRRKKSLSGAKEGEK